MKRSVLNQTQRRTSPQTRRANIAADRAKILALFDILTRGGMAQAKAANALGTSVSSVWRWRRRRNLSPDTALCGRKSLVQLLGITQSMLNEVQRLVLNAGSVRAACREFMKSKDCPPHIAHALQAHEPFLQSLIRAVPKIEVRKFVEFRGRDWTVVTPIE